LETQSHLVQNVKIYSHYFQFHVTSHLFSGVRNSENTPRPKRYKKVQKVKEKLWRSARRHVHHTHEWRLTQLL